MKSFIINKSINIISRYYNYSNEKLELIKYGLESIYLTIFKAILFIVISFYLKDTIELLLFILTYGLLRLTAFGVHAKKSIHCWISSCIFFIGIPLIIKYHLIPRTIILYSILLFILFIILYAPADTEKRPLINKRKRKIFKISSIIIALIYYIIILKTKNIKVMNLLYLSIVLESLLILPISYKVLGMKYSNYLYIEKEEKK